MSSHHWRNFLLLVVDGAVFGFAISLVSEATIVPAFMELLSGNPLLVGAIGAAYALGRYLPQLVGSHLVVGLRRRKPLFLALVVGQRVGLFALAFSASLIGVIPSWAVITLFLISFSFYAATTGVILPVYGDFVAKSLYRGRGWLFGLVQLIGGSLGFFAALWAEDILANSVFPVGHQTIFWTSVLIASSSIVLIALLKEEIYPIAHPRPAFSATLTAAYRILRHDENFRRYLVARAVIALSTMGIGFVVVDGLAGPLVGSDAALLAAVFVLSQGALGFCIGLVGNYRGWKLIIVLTGVLLASAMAVTVLADSRAWYVGALVLLGGVNAVVWVADPNISMEMAPPQHTGIYLGLTFTALAPFFITGPLLAGWLVPMWGYHSLFLIAGGLGLLGSALSLRIVEPRKAVPLK